MGVDDVGPTILGWFKEEGMLPEQVDDPNARFHIRLRYPNQKRGHVFGIILPKNRDLVVVSSFTRVDAGQQEEMMKHAQGDVESWEEWLHETRLQLIRSEVDWQIHVGRPTEERQSGPLQAFNLSNPIRYDGLKKHTLMMNLRKIWLTKLALIHEIKFAYGRGRGEPGPVDDLAGRKPSSPADSGSVIEFNEQVGFGDEFDPSEWA